MARTSLIALVVAAASVPLGGSVALAQSTMNGAPPPDEKALVAAPTAPGTEPVITKPATDGTTATLSAGGSARDRQLEPPAGNPSTARSTTASDTTGRAPPSSATWLRPVHTPVGGQWAVETVGNFQGKESGTTATSRTRRRSSSSSRAATTGSRVSISAVSNLDLGLRHLLRQGQPPRARSGPRPATISSSTPAARTRSRSPRPPAPRARRSRCPSPAVLRRTPTSPSAATSRRARRTRCRRRRSTTRRASSRGSATPSTRTSRSAAVSSTCRASGR